MTKSSPAPDNSRLREELRNALLQVDQAQTQLQQVRIALTRLDQQATMMHPGPVATPPQHAPATAQQSAQVYPPVPTYGQRPAPQGQPAPAPAPQPGPQRSPAQAQGVHPAPATWQGRNYAPTPGSKVEPYKPWWTDEKTLVRVLGVFGGVVTFAGIAFLIGLGIERGLLGPTSRMVMAIAFGVILVGTAHYLQGRKIHTAAVGAAYFPGLFTLGVSVWAAQNLMEWTTSPVSAGLFLALGLGAAALTYWWRRLPLIIGTAIAMAGIHLESFALEGDWKFFPYVLPALVLAIIGVALRSRKAILWAASTAIFIQLFSLFEQWEYPLIHGLFGLITLLIFIAICEFEWDEPRIALEFAIAGNAFALVINNDTTVIGLMAVVMALWVWLSAQERIAAWVLLALSLVVLYIVTDPTAQPMVAFLSMAVGSLVVWIFAQRKFPESLWFLWLAVIVVMTFATLPATLGFHASPYAAWSGYLYGVGALLVIVTMFLQRASLLTFPDHMRWTFAGVGLYLTVIVITAFAATTTWAISPNLDLLGLFIGQAIVSIAWITLAAWLMLRQHSSIGTGTAIAIAGTIKLVFIDMASMDGLPRVLAFLISGIVLIVVATRRGKVGNVAATMPPAVSLEHAPANAAASGPVQPTAMPSTQPHPGVAGTTSSHPEGEPTG